MATGIALRWRRFSNNCATTLIKSFSSSSSSAPQEDEVENSTQSSKHKSVISGLKSPLQQPPPPQQTSRLQNLNSNKNNLQNIANSLSGFRSRTAAPLPKGADPFTLVDSYNRNVIHPESQQQSESAGRTGFKGLDKLQEKIKQNSKQNATPAPAMPLSQFPVNKNNNRNQQNQNVSKSMFGKELVDDKEGVVYYDCKELGQQLKRLRPEEAKTSFSLEELNKRLMKLRELDRNRPPETKGVSYMFKQSLLAIDQDLDTTTTDKTRAVSAHRDFLTPNYMKDPPKEDLVEKYFHPDNMSSAEKMKLELQKVRDEFKMSESDCGSSRVQVAMLTTKIKHLSTALHKKDKHSRKGLQAMVQKRKKLLKYMRRTDWDSYCLVLSELGLRDNPDYKS